jgi:threonylcarbamoyladenosine tRNA methylthiotransferase MtaB
MPQVPAGEIKARAGRLRAAAARRKAAWLEGLIGSRQRVLIERDGRGHAENFAEVAVSGAIGAQTGRTREVIVTGRDGEHLLATA